MFLAVLRRSGASVEAVADQASRSLGLPSVWRSHDRRFLILSESIPDFTIANGALLAHWGRPPLAELSQEKLAEAWTQHKLGLPLALDPQASSLVLYDSGPGHLIAIRDKLGRGPLFYSVTENYLALSNAACALLHLPEVDPQPDQEAVMAALVRKGLMLKLPERTLFRGIRQVPPSHALIAKGENVQTERYWTPDVRPALSLLAAPAELLASLRQTVSRFTESNSKVGSLLSGGLDSSAITALAAWQRKEQPLPTFSHVVTSGSPLTVGHGRSYHEKPYIEALRKQYPNICLNLFGTETYPASAMESCYWFGAGYPLNFSNLGWFESIFQAAAGQGLTTLLGGDLGNLTISYPGPVPSSWRSRVRRLLRAQTPKLEHLLPTTAVQASHLKELIARRLFEKEEDQDPRLAALLGGSPGRFSLAVHSRLGLFQEDPTADPGVLAVCLAAPSTSFRRGRESRLLVRDALRGLIPDQILDRKNRGFQAADWAVRLQEQMPTIRAELKDLRDLSATRGVIDWDRVCQAAQELPNPRDPSLTHYHRWNRMILGALEMGRFWRWVENGDPKRSLKRSLGLESEKGPAPLAPHPPIM